MPTKQKSSVFTDEEKDAMKQRVRELKAGDADAEGDVLAKIAEMKPADRGMAQRIHELIKAEVPSLTPKLWYGMPAYAKAGKLICHFQPAQKFRTRYATLGFSDQAQLDEGSMWPNAYAINQLTPSVEAEIVALVRRAAG